MKEFVDIEISGAHLRYDENDPIAVNISGNHYADGDTHKITYVEEAQGFDEIILNTIIVKKNRVEIIKEGVVNSKMVFANNSRFKTIYDTPFGRLNMETETKLLLIDMNEDEINVYIEYLLYIEGDRASNSKMRIHIVEAVDRVDNKGG